MKTPFADYLAWWGPYAVGILAVGLSIVMKMASEREARTEPLERGWWMLTALSGVGVVAGMLLIGAFAGPADLKWRFAGVFLLGGAAAVAAACYSHIRADRATAPSADTLAGIGAALILMALMRNYFREAPMLYLFVTALGVWVVAAVAGYGSSERNESARTLSLASIAVAAAVAMGVLRYPGSGLGSLLAVDMLALALLIAMVASLFAGVGSRLRGLSGVAAPILMLAVLWWLGRLLGQSLMRELAAGLCVVTGAAAAALIYLLALSASGSESPVLSRAECAALVTLTTAACAAASMRWLGAYGVSLAGLGSLAALPMLAVIGDRTRKPGAPVGNVPVVLVAASAAAFAAVALARTFLQTASGGGGALDLYQAYTVPGLAVGGALSLIPGVLAARQARNRGPMLEFVRGAAAVVAASAIVIAVAYLWRGSGSAGLVAGIAVGVFYTVVATALWNTDEARVDLAPGIQLFAVTLVPILLAATLNLTRAQKVSVMIWTMAAAALVVILASATRAITRKREDAGGVSAG